MEKQYESSIIKNHKITQKDSFDGVPLTGYVASSVTHCDHSPSVGVRRCPSVSVCPSDVRPSVHPEFAC